MKKVSLLLLFFSLIILTFTIETSPIDNIETQSTIETTVAENNQEIEIETQTEINSDLLLILQKDFYSFNLSYQPLPVKQNPKKEPVFSEPLEGIYWYNNFRTSQYNTKTTLCGGAEIDIDFLAKLLYCEAGSMGWTGQVYVCSAILNLCDRIGESVYDAGHVVRRFSVATYVDYATPLPRQYEVIDYVLNGGRVTDVKYFRTNHYHGFGTPVCQIENVCFSK